MRTLAVAVLGVLLLGAAAPAEWSKAEVVSLAETDYRFEPSNLSLRAKARYRLHLENRGKDMHEFTAPAFFKAVVLGNPEVLNKDRTEIVLQPGEQTDLYFVAGEAGRYPFSCADHDWAGMTGEIVVQ